MPRPTMVWLQTLDECKRSLGDSRKLGVEAIKNGVLGGGNRQGKQRTFLQFGGQHDTNGIELDEVERQVINGRPELIDNFASQNGNVERRLNQEINCFFSVRIRDDFVRTCGGSDIGNNAIDFVQMLCCT